MAIVVDTKDCTALSDAELSEMADICADGPAGYDVGLLSKQRDEWVLITQSREGNKLLGFAFCTLERIGGTPCVLLGLASVKRNGKRDAALKVLIGDELRRAVLAFPDEDVLVGTRLLDPAGFQAFKGLEDVVPGLPGGPGFPHQEARAVSAVCAGLRIWSVYVPNGREPDSDHYRYSQIHHVAAHDKLPKTLEHANLLGSY